MTTTITVDAPDLIELAEILDYLAGSVDTLVAPATTAPSTNGDAYNLNDMRTEITRLLHRILPNPPPPHPGLRPVGDDTATTTCGVCGLAFTRHRRQRWCSTECRQTAWRRRRAAPIPPVPAKPTTVYECDNCITRYLGEQRCHDCNTWCRRIGPGGLCPHCDEPVAITDLAPRQT
jgi:hypothetical protein